jgi:hypothetical protein
MHEALGSISSSAKKLNKIKINKKKYFGFPVKLVHTFS